MVNNIEGRLRELIFVVFRRGQGVCIFQWLFQKIKFSCRGGIRIVRHVQSNIITKNWNNSLVKKIIKEKKDRHQHELAGICGTTLTNRWPI